MFIGLKRNPSQSIRKLFAKRGEDQGKGYFKLMSEGFLAAKDLRIALAYIGGLIARADSVAISLFIPTVINHFFVEQGLCTVDPHTPAEEIKEVPPLSPTGLID